MIRRPNLAALILERINEMGLNDDGQLDVDQVSNIVNCIIREIISSIAEGRTVSIRGFGTFKVKLYKCNTKAEIYRASCPDEEPNREYYFARPAFKAGIVLRSLI